MDGRAATVKGLKIIFIILRLLVDLTMKKRRGSNERNKIVYDPFKSPPAYDKAKEHRKATMVGIISRKGRKRRCECCMCPFEKEPFDLRCSNSELGFLGTSLAFYFEAMKISISLLALILLSVLLLTGLLNHNFKCCEFRPPFFGALVLNNLSLPIGLLVPCLLSIIVIFLARKYGVRTI